MTERTKQRAAFERKQARVELVHWGLIALTIFLTGLFLGLAAMLMIVNSGP
jgi:hypothetical protein